MADPTMIPGVPDGATGAGMTGLGFVLYHLWGRWNQSQKTRADVRQQDAETDVKVSAGWREIVDRLEVEIRAMRTEVDALKLQAAQHDVERLRWHARERDLEAEVANLRARVAELERERGPVSPVTPPFNTTLSGA